MASAAGGAASSPQAPLPRLVVFDLDWTLWPLDVDTHVDAPFARDAATGAVRDRNGRGVKLFADTRRVLQWLRAQGVAVAFASRTTDAAAAEQLLKAFLLFEPGAAAASDAASVTLFDLLPSRAHFQAYPSGFGGPPGASGRAKTRHFEKIMAASGARFADILFFDDADDNIEVASAAGVASVLLEDGEGITWERFERGLALWRRAR